MIPYEQTYIIPGDVYPDETVLCIRCAVMIARLSYREMPKINSPKEVVNVAHKIKLGNYRQFSVVMRRNGALTILSLPCCQECLKQIVPEIDSDDIIRQIKKAVQLEAEWVGVARESIDGYVKTYDDAKILRKLNPQELMENKISQEA